MNNQVTKDPTIEISPASAAELGGLKTLLGMRWPSYWMRKVPESSLDAFLQYAVESARYVILLARAAQGPALFWLAANIAGLCLGASQSAARALVGVLAPTARHGEFFGLWGLAVKFSSILGPVTYGAVTWISGGDHRLAILITGSYFVVGLLILVGVDAERGRRAAMGSHPPVPAQRRGSP